MSESRLAVPGWLRGYGLAQLRPDLVAGITLAAYLLPAGIGDASLARLPPEAGLYACLFSGLVFWLFCSSRHTAVTVTSAISLLLGASLGEVSGGDPARFAALAAATAMLVSLIAFIAWLARAGVIVNFISETVMIGFKAGVALFLAGTQLPKLFGLPGAHGDFFEMAAHFARHLPETKPAALALGVAALVLLTLGKVLWKNRPVALVVVAAGIGAATAWDLGAHGVKLLGEIPAGLPMPGPPRAIDWSDAAAVLRDLNALLPLAFACFMLAAVETAAIGRMFAAKHGGRFDSNREFLALAAANLACGLGRGYPVSGGMSQSLVNESAGARTPLSGLVAALLILVVILYFSQLLASLPQPVLAAIVLMAVAGLFNLSALAALWRIERGEFAIAMAALAGVLAAGLLHGVLIGAVLSLLLLLRAASSPHVAFLGRIPGSALFADLERHPENEPVPGVLIARPESGLFYFNVGHVRDAILERAQAAAPAARLVILDLSSAPRVDMQGALALAELGAELSAHGTRLRISGARAVVRDVLRRHGLEGRHGPLDRATLAELVEEFQKGGGANGVA